MKHMYLYHIHVNVQAIEETSISFTMFQR
jgi:hypothetical protein